jgi:hypothetical protein
VRHTIIRPLSSELGALDGRLESVKAATPSSSPADPTGPGTHDDLEHDTSSDVVITGSYPSAPDLWQVAGHSLAGTKPFFAWAVCMTMEPGTVIATAG